MPEDHLVRFIVEVVDGLELRAMERAYGGRGSAAYPPSLLLSLLIYGYATGVFSSRRIERSTYDSVAFRFIAAGSHPDHDTLATFRRRFLDELAGLFVQMLEVAQEMKLLKLGTISLDGTKVQANASRHSALSHGHIEKLEAQLKTEVQELLALAEQAYNAQAAVDTESMLVVVPAVTQACNDKEQVEPMLERLAELPESLGRADKLLADTGYFSAGNVEACAKACLDPHIAVKREHHHLPPLERFTEPAALVEGATPAIVVDRIKLEHGQFTKHHVDQELQADSCAVKMLSHIYPDGQGFARSINAFVVDLPKMEPSAHTKAPQNDVEALAESIHDIVMSPLMRHPNTRERTENLQTIYREVTSTS